MTGQSFPRGPVRPIPPSAARRAALAPMGTPRRAPSVATPPAPPAGGVLGPILAPDTTALDAHHGSVVAPVPAGRPGDHRPAASRSVPPSSRIPALVSQRLGGGHGRPVASAAGRPADDRSGPRGNAGVGPIALAAHAFLPTSVGSRATGRSGSLPRTPPAGG